MNFEEEPRLVLYPDVTFRDYNGLNLDIKNVVCPENFQELIEELRTNPTAIVLASQVEERVSNLKSFEYLFAKNIQKRNAIRTLRNLRIGIPLEDLLGIVSIESPQTIQLVYSQDNHGVCIPTGINTIDSYDELVELLEIFNFTNYKFSSARMGVLDRVEEYRF